MKNHLKATHKMTREDADRLYETYFPMSERNSAISKAQNVFQAAERNRKYQQLRDEGLGPTGLGVPETILDVSEDRVLVFDD